MGEHGNITTKLLDNASSKIPSRWIETYETTSEETESDDDESSDSDDTSSVSSSSSLSSDSDSSSSPVVVAPKKKPDRAESVDSVISIDQRKIDIFDFGVMNIFVDLKMYYEKLKNKFEMRNMDNLI